MTQDSIPRQMRNTTAHNGVDNSHNGVDNSSRQSPCQQELELSNGVSCHGNNGFHDEKLEIEQCGLSRSCVDVKVFDDGYTSRANGGNLESRGCKVSAQRDTVHVNGSNGNNVNIADALHRATNINGIRTNSNASELLDIRNDRSKLCLLQLVREGLCDPKPSLSSSMLWDDRGLQLFEDITQLPDYYISGLEKQIIEQHCGDIARKIQPGSMIVDLGCGSTDKVKPILQALHRMGREADYYALDLSPISVRRSVDTMSSIPFKNIRCHGVLGTYEDARDWLQSSEKRDTPKCILSLGASIGNLTETEAVEFLKNFAGPLYCNRKSCKDQQTAAENPMWTLLLGLDTCSSEQQVRAAYADPFGANSRFLLNALEHVNALLGYKAFRSEQWTVHREWENLCFKQYLVPIEDVMFERTLLRAGTRVLVSQSQKFNTEHRAKLWEGAGVRQLLSLRCQDAKYGNDPKIWMITLEEGGNT